MFKVITTQGTTVNIGEVKAGQKPVGMNEDAATSDANSRNARAVEMGIATRYRIEAIS